MKRILLITAFLLPVLLQGKAVDPETARSVAADVFAGFPVTRSGGGEIRLLWDGTTVTRGLISDPPFYVFGRAGGGFVIISGEDCIRPVLGFSDRNEFRVEGMPSHVAAWFEGLADGVREAREKGLVPSEQVRGEWTRVRSGEGGMTPVVELGTAEWNQREPYNLMMPVINGSHCLTGCGTTATAIVMRHHQWPKAGTGELPDYTYGYRTIVGHSLGHEYKWSEMPLRYKSSDPPMGVDQLMRDVGVMNRCQFGLEASATSTSYILPALSTYMDYDKSIMEHARRSYAQAEWERMLKDELDAGRPLLYCAMNSVSFSGHLWVIDGYTSGGFFSMNWGWGGSYNGDYLISLSGEEDKLSYTEDQSAILPIMPASSSRPFDIMNYVNVRRSNLQWDYRKYSRASCTHIISNDHQWVATDTLTFRAALTDRDGKPKAWLGESDRFAFSGREVLWLSWNELLPENVTPDDLIIVFWEKDGEWIPLRHEKEGLVRMKGDLPIEDCTTISFDAGLSSSFNLKIISDRTSYIELFRISNGTEHLWMRGYAGSMDLTSDWIQNYRVRISNLAESKEFDIIMKDTD